MDHLSSEQISGWQDRILSPDALLEVGSHIAECAVCRERLRGKRTPIEGMAQLQQQLADGLAAEPTIKEPLVGPADIGIPDDRALQANGHVGYRAPNQSQPKDLRRRASLDARPPKRWLAAAVVAALAIGTIFWSTNIPTTTIDAPMVGSDPPSSEIVRLLDVRGPIALLPDDSLQGVPQQFAAGVARLLRSPEALIVPDAAIELAHRAEQQRADDLTPSRVAVIAPISIVELDDRPLFQWTAFNEAIFEIEIFDSRFERIESSGALRTDSWKPSRSLPRDELLSWKVTATIDGEQESFPSAPRPPAVFRIASTAQSDRVAAARASESHMVLALALWEVGAVELAATEFALLHRLNPDSSIATKLAERSRRLVTNLDAGTAGM